VSVLPVATPRQVVTPAAQQPAPAPVPAVIPPTTPAPAPVPAQEAGHEVVWVAVLALAGLLALALLKR
jgi:hypothetical protein